MKKRMQDLLDPRWVMVLVLAGICGMANFSVPFASAAWSNEPAGSQPLIDWAFNQNQNGRGAGFVWDVYNSGQIVTDPTAPLSPSNVVKATLPAYAKSGGMQVIYTTPRPYRELYVGFWWRTNPQFQGRIVQNKLFFVGGPGANGYFGMHNPPGSPTMVMGWGHNTSELDNSHVCMHDLGLWCPANIGPSVVTIGKWTKVETYFKSSTTATSRDGVMRWWIDGVLAGNYTNINYAQNGLDNWQWNNTWDGSGDMGVSNTVEWNHFIDHLYVSAPNCGLNGCPSPAYLVITSSMPLPRTGTPYVASLSADGGSKPFTWFLASGKLPNGLTLNQSTGVISGTPTCVGRSDFTIRVTDASQPALTATKSYTLITSGTGTCPTSIVTGQESNAEATLFTAKAASGKLAFNLPVTSSAQYRLNVYDLTGKKVYEHRSLGQREISIERNLKNGIYLATFEQGTQSSALRFQVMN